MIFKYSKRFRFAPSFNKENQPRQSIYYLAPRGLVTPVKEIDLKYNFIAYT